MIKIYIDDKKLIATLKELKSRLSTLRPFMREVRDIMRNAVEENFAKQGRPAWHPLAPDTIAERRRLGYWPGMILQRHSAAAGLLGSIHGYYSDKSAVVGTNKRYAAIHQFGGIVKHPARQGVVTHFKKHGKGQRFATADDADYGRKLNHRAHNVTIPSRPFLALTDDDKAQILSAAKTYLAADI